MEITSPPYPRKNCNSEKLHSLLIELYNWVEENREWSETNAERLDAPTKPFLPDLAFVPSCKLEPFKELPVMTLGRNLAAVRVIREMYDDILRNYEEVDLWDSDACIFLRLQLFSRAALLLEYAFLDDEKREAKIKKSSKTQVLIQDVTDLFKNIIGNANQTGGISDADIDRLFHGDSSDNPSDS
jgi:hypothetical protein